MTFLALLAAPALWKPIPKTDPAAAILSLVRQAQPAPTDLPEGSTYNYIWAQHMMAWMVAERGGLMPRDECVRRLKGLMARVSPWTTHHGFYFDAYDPATGKPTSQNVYFQGWWIWALILTKAGYPEAAEEARAILKRFDYDAAGMITSDHRYLVADRNAATGAITYTIQPTGDIAGELRTPVIVYTYLTGAVTPWRVTAANSFIEVGGQKLLSVWHHFTFDPFYVHSCFPELGFFQRSYDDLVVGANAYRAANGGRFYATRMEPLEAWNENRGEWPNTEHRVAKPWTAWLADPKAPVMEKAWIPGYGVAQTFDNWEFHWGTGPVTGPHPKKVGGTGAFEAGFRLETLAEATKPPRLTRLLLNARSLGGGPLIVKVNGQEVGRTAASASLTKAIVLTPKAPLMLGKENLLRLESSGEWEIGATEGTFRSVRWNGEEVPAIGLQVFVDGQRWDRENPYAFLCRAAGAYGDYPWKILAERTPEEFGKRSVAWVGDYSTEVHTAHVVYNVSTVPKTVRYRLSAWEKGRPWTVVDYDDPKRTIPSTRIGDTLSWTLVGRGTSLLR